MKQCYFADYTIGKDAYKNIKDVCLCLGKHALIIGGETALSKSIEKLKAAGIKPVTLGRRILRTETAAEAVVSMLMYAYDEI